MLAHYPFVLKNFRTYFSNIYRRKILRTNEVAPYSAIFYATHKCNLDCTYCTQKNPEVFSEELDTAQTIEIFRRIRKDVDTLLITGGECLILMRKDIEELVRAAKQDCKFRSVVMVTNGVLLDKRQPIFEHLNGLIVSLDAITHDPSEPMSKSAQIPKVLDNLMLAKSKLPPGAITLSCVLELWNLDEAEKILDYCRQHDFQFSVQSAQNNGKHPNFTYLQDARYQAFVDKLIDMRKSGAARINGTPKLLNTLLRFEEFKCYPTMFPRRISQRRCLLSVRSAGRDRRQHLRRRLDLGLLQARQEALRRNAVVQELLFSVWQCAVFLLRGGLWGLGGRYGPPRIEDWRPGLSTGGPRGTARVRRQPPISANVRLGPLWSALFLS